MLSFKRGRPIAYIKGGQHNGKIVHLYDPEIEKKERQKTISETKGKKKKYEEESEDSEEEDIEPDIQMQDPLQMLEEDFFITNGKYKRLKPMEREKLKKALIKKQEPLEDDLSKFYHDANKIIDHKSKYEISLDDGGEIVPLPNKDKSERLMFAGPTESGKSTRAGSYLEEFKKMFPKRKIVIFSRVSKDQAYDYLKPLRIKMDEDLVKKPLEPKVLANSICVFDDIDTIPNKAVCDAVLRLRDDLNETGRHENIYVISMSHQLMNYKKTRDMLNEVSSVTFFPQSGSYYHINRFLKTYCGLDNKQIMKIMKLPSRWVTIHKNFPMFVIYQSGCYLLNKNLP